MTTIKSCPFCDHDNVEIDETGDGEFAVDCPECRAIGPISSDIMSAIAQWNGGLMRQSEPVVSVTPAGRGEISPAASDRSTSLAINSDEADAVVEPQTQDRAPADARSDETPQDRAGHQDAISKFPPLEEGEIYIGAIGNKAGEAYHLILLPGDNARATQKNQLEWAKSICGDLPNKLEAEMLFAHAKDQFQLAWYWTNETYVDSSAVEDSNYAWVQSFYDGTQINYRKIILLRARAVRRLPI